MSIALFLKNVRFSLFILSVFALSTTVSCGQSSEDLTEEGSTVQARFPNSVLSSTQIWKVKASDLNCRASAGTAAPVVFSFTKGITLDVVAGAPRPVLNGFVWIKVNPRGDIDHNECFVAADDRFLLPANNLDASNHSLSRLFSGQVFQVKLPLNCRAFPSKNAAVIFAEMPVGTFLDVSLDTGSELPHVQWSNDSDSYWVHVDPRGDSDHNQCWVSATKPNVAIVR